MLRARSAFPVVPGSRAPWAPMPAPTPAGIGLDVPHAADIRLGEPISMPGAHSAQLTFGGHGRDSFYRRGDIYQQGC